MHRIIGCISISLLVSSLCGCLIREESGLNESVPSNEASSVTDEVALSDGGITAPVAPTLSISATAGALNFKWVDSRTNTKSITDTTLYEYNSRTEQEAQLNTGIAPGDLRFTLPITPHRLAWYSLSYRVEICTTDDCVSSLRVPVRTLLDHAITGFTPSNTDIRPSFGDDLAINATGNIAVASSPITASAAVLLHNGQQWIQASTLGSEHFSSASDADMLTSVSASGDTVVIASIASTSNPVIVVFDRLGENWIETATIVPFEPAAIDQRWDTTSLNLKLSDNGDRIVFAAQPNFQSVNRIDNRGNQVLVFDRSAFNWTQTANLAVPLQHTRLRSISTSASINKIVALSALDDLLYLHEFALSVDQWRESSSQMLDTINPSIDTQVIGSHDLTYLSLAAWELDNDNRRSAVAWKLEKRPMGWLSVDSIRLPPTADQSARLRLAGDAKLQSLAVGWQAESDANLAFYSVDEQRWQHQFSVPQGLNLNRTLPFVQSIAVSADNSTALIGTTNTGTKNGTGNGNSYGNGGLVSSFR